MEIEGPRETTRARERETARACMRVHEWEGRRVRAIFGEELQGVIGIDSGTSFCV